ncbi:MAG: carboxypeptidase regulatory-like domain-containing protein [Chthonomonadales bacterium]|nr:carboxypeptidase regulatory-like domain-containing protein [Chthonomonadales bacterium]
MKQGTLAFFGLVAAVTVVALAGCGGGTSGANPRLMGRVADTAGVPVEGVTVSLEANPSVTTVTNANGVYVLRGVPTSGNFMVRYRKAGFADSHAIGLVSDGKYSTMDVVLFREGRAASVATSSEQVVADARSDGLNAKVTFPPNRIVNSAGSPVASANITVTTAVPTDPRYNSAYPSSFVGVVGGSDVPLTSFGAVHVALKDGSGNALRLDASKPATIEFPIAAGHDPGTPEVPLWSLNASTGKWVQEGVATRDNSVSPAVYRGQVTHFSWWAINIYPSSTHTIIVQTVEDPTISPMVPVCGALVTARRDRGAWQSRAITSIPQGLAVFLAPPPGPYWVEAKKDYHEDKGVYSVTTVGNVTTVIYWLRPASTGAPGGCPDCG